VEWFLNLNALHFEAPITETPTVGTIEDWVYINMTGDTHSIHNHLVTFQVADTVRRRSLRNRLRWSRRRAWWNRSDSVCDGTPMQPDPAERGFKDTVKANPGEFTTIRAQYDLPTGVSAPQT
jgi:spore coat protein A, manganese oxidase